MRCELVALADALGPRLRVLTVCIANEAHRALILSLSLSLSLSLTLTLTLTLIPHPLPSPYSYNPNQVYIAEAHAQEEWPVGDAHAEGVCAG